MGTNYLSIPGMRRGASAVTQYRGVVLDTTAYRVLPITNANAERPLGILQDDPAATNEPCDVAYMGVVRAEYGGTIAIGDRLAFNNNGQLIADAEVSGGGTDLHHVADALEAGASGEIHWTLLHTPVLIGTE